LPVSITRIPYHPSHGRHHEVDKKLPDGEWVVWWYSTVKYNREGVVPLVRILLRRLDGNTLTDEFHEVLLGLTRLGLYRQGVILVDGRIEAKIASEERYFDVSFKTGSWSYSLASKMKLSAPDSAYKLPSSCDPEFLLSLKQPKGLLLLNCLDYFVRGYSTRSELHRILTTFDGACRMSRLFDLEFDNERDKTSDSPDEWVICPTAAMVKDDAKLLAQYFYKDHRTTLAVNLLFSQFGSSFRAGTPQPFQAMPWFSGTSKLRCRGFPINGGRDFLCIELIGSSLPETKKKVKFVRPKLEQRDPAIRDRFIPESNPRIGADTPDALAMTDTGRPASNFPSEEIEADEYEVIGENKVETEYVTRPYGRNKAIPNEAPPPSMLATGESLGLGDEEIGKLTIHSRSVSTEADGALMSIWKVFEYLHETQQLSLEWFVPPDHCDTAGPPRCTLFSERTAEQAKHNGWLNMSGGARRGMLLLHIKAQGKSFLVVELQRKPPKEASSAGESFCGLICEVKDVKHMAEVFDALDHALPAQRGVFKNIPSALPKKHYVFPHRAAGKLSWPQASVALALKSMEIDVNFNVPQAEPKT